MLEENKNSKSPEESEKLKNIYKAPLGERDNLLTKGIPGITPRSLKEKLSFWIVNNTVLFILILFLIAVSILHFFNLF